MIDTGLNQQTLDHPKQILLAQPKVAEVILFGSRAQGNYRAGSDIDLALKSTDIINFSELAHMQNQLDSLMLPYKIDLVIYNNIQNQALIQHIDRVGIAI